MKVLLVGTLFMDGGTILLVEQALSNIGHSVRHWNIVSQEKPVDDDYDVVIVWCNRPVPVEAFKGKPVGYVYLDDPEFWKEANPAYLPENCAKGYKKVFTNMKWDGMPEGYHWLPMGCTKTVHGLLKVTDEDRKAYGSDVVFIGTNRGKRAELLKGVVSGLKKDYTLRVWGNGWGREGITTRPVYFYEFVKVLSCCKVVVTEHWKNGFSTNDCEKPACGGALTITDCPVVKSEYSEMPFYRTTQELIDLIHYFLEHEEERKSIVYNLQKVAHDKFSYENQLAKLISIITN